MLMQELLTTEVGLLSLTVVLVTIGIGTFIFFRLRALIREEQASRDQDERSRPE